MNRIEKFLAALDTNRRRQVEAVILRIVANDLANMDVKKLRGREQEFRVRVGRMRIQFVRDRNENRILVIEWRNSHTY